MTEIRLSCLSEKSSAVVETDFRISLLKKYTMKFEKMFENMKRFTRLVHFQ